MQASAREGSKVKTSLFYYVFQFEFSLFWFELLIDDLFFFLILVYVFVFCLLHDLYTAYFVLHVEGLCSGSLGFCVQSGWGEFFNFLSISFGHRFCIWVFFVPIWVTDRWAFLYFHLAFCVRFLLLIWILQKVLQRVTWFIWALVIGGDDSNTNTFLLAEILSWVRLFEFSCFILTSKFQKRN